MWRIDSPDNLVAGGGGNARFVMANRLTHDANSLNTRNLRNTHSPEFSFSRSARPLIRSFPPFHQRKLEPRYLVHISLSWAHWLPLSICHSLPWAANSTICHFGGVICVVRVSMLKSWLTWLWRHLWSVRHPWMMLKDYFALLWRWRDVQSTRFAVRIRT